MHQSKHLLLLLLFPTILLNVAFSKGAPASTASVNSVEAPVVYWDRAESKEKTEHVYGSGFLHWIYGTKTGWALDQILFSKVFTSKLCGVYQSSSWSQRDIQPFIQKFNIKMSDFEPGPYANFNAFFSRKLLPGVRTFVETPSDMPAFVEGRYFAYEQALPDERYPVKGKTLPVTALLQNEEKAKPFLGGPMLVGRLNPTDYHRFHFPDNGRVLETYSISGKLESVSPIALRENHDIFLENERQVTIIETENFGRLAYIEVGALCVGKIVQTAQAHQSFLRGDEKGYFLFGGSTVIIIGQPGFWKPDSDLLRHTSDGIETLIKLGERIASVN